MGFPKQTCGDLIPDVLIAWRERTQGYMEGSELKGPALLQVAKRMRHALVGALRQGNSSEVDACCLGAHSLLPSDSFPDSRS